MESTISFQDQEDEKNQSQKVYEKETLLDPPDDIAKSETPELPQPLLTELPITRRYSKPSFVLPSLDENSKAPTPPPSAPSSRRSSASEFLGALPSHEQLRRFSIASNKTDSSYHPDSQRTSPFQSGASSKAQSPLITGRKGSVSSILKESETNPYHVDYQTDPFVSLSIGPSAASARQKDSTTPTPTSSATMPSESQGHPDLSSFVEMTSHSPYAYVPVSTYWPYTGLPYSVFGTTQQPPPFYVPQLPSQLPASTFGMSSDVGPTKKQGKKKGRKKDSKKSQFVSTPSQEKDIQPLSQAPTPAGTPKAAPHSPHESKMGPMMLGNVTPRAPAPEFDGFQDDYLEDSEYKYKTAICRSHLATGYCEYGPACQYAHGVQELRPRDFDVKFKTELCKNYHAMGMCWFGSRCRFIHDEYRIQAGENEFWLVAPSENLVRIELVDPDNTARKKLLQSLVSLPPRCFPKPWETQFREFSGEIPPQLAQLSQFQSLTQQFHLPVPPLQSIITPTPIPVFPIPPVPTASIPPYALQSAPTSQQQTPQPLPPQPLPPQPILSHTSPAFIPGRFASYVPFVQAPQQQQPIPAPTQGVDVQPTSSVPETGPKVPTVMVQTEIPLERMNPVSLWHLTQNPSTRTFQLHNNFPLPASGPVLDPREGPKFSLFTTSSTVRAPPPPRTARDARTERKKGSRRRKSKKNQQGASGQSQGTARKHDLPALNVGQSKPDLKVSPSVASPTTMPRTQPSTSPISKTTSTSSSPRTQTTRISSTSRTPKTPKPSAPFSGFESPPVSSTIGGYHVPPSSFQPTSSFPQPYTTLPPSGIGSPKRMSPSTRGGRGLGPWGRGRGRGGRGLGPEERASLPSRGTPSGMTHVNPSYYR